MFCGFMTLFFSAGPTTFGTFLGTMIPFALLGLPILFVLSLVFAPFSRRRMYIPYTDDRSEKPKRGESLEEMMTLLSDEDIDELRRRAKQRIAEGIDSGDIEDVQTFEELLSRTKQKRK
jgi:hypothetical protein